MPLISIEDAQYKYERAWTLLQEMQLHRIALGLALIDIEDYDAWKPLGFSSFQSLCSAPPQSGGFGLRERTRQTTIQIARRYVLELGVNSRNLVDIPYSNLALVVSIATPENIEEVLSDARCLAKRDMALNKKRGKYGGVEEPFDAESEPDYIKGDVTCPHCGEKFIPIQ